MEPQVLQKYDLLDEDENVLKQDTFGERDVDEYVVGCVAKQCGVDHAEAAGRVQALDQATRVAICNAGRRGDVARVRELLGV